MQHPAVEECAVIGHYHPKWEERPLLIVVAQNEDNNAKEDILEWFDGKIARWWIPEDVVFVSELPLTATGKVSKMLLRKQMSEYKFPGAD